MKGLKLYANYVNAYNTLNKTSHFYGPFTLVKQTIDRVLLNRFEKFK